MKLSMWTIYDHLIKEGFDAKEHIVEGLPCVNHVRQSTKRSYSPDYAELVQLGKVIILSYDMETITVRNADIIDVANCINDTFDFFFQWEHDLYECMIKGGTLQELLDIAAVVFDRPMFIKNDSTRTFAYTTGYSSDIHPYWNEIVHSMEHGLADRDVVKIVSSDPEFRGIFNERYPSVKWSPAYENRVLHANIFINNQRAAEIVTLENGKPFNQGEIHLMNVFAELVERYISAHSDIFQTGSDVSFYLTQLIEDGFIEDEKIQAICNYMRLDRDDEFCVLVASGTGLSDTPFLSSLREKLEGQIKDAIVIPYKGQIVILRGLKNITYDEMVADYKLQIPKEGFCWGLSYEFRHIEKIPEYYRQACEIMENAVFDADHYVTMYDMAPKIISGMFRERADTSIVIHPDLIRLENTDIVENTQYCETLFHFLLCGGNFTDAARIMDLHRNTLIYRINKIREILRSNLDDMDNRKLLLYSFLLMGKEY